MELYFDPALENQVLKAWNTLARWQLGNRLIDAAARQHLPLLHLPAAALPPPSTSTTGDPLLCLAPSLCALASCLDPLLLTRSSLAALLVCVLWEFQLLPISGYGMDIVLFEVRATIRELLSYQLVGSGSGSTGAD